MDEKEVYEEERKLAILLAQLNADIQVTLAETFGLAALSIASFVAGNQFLTQNNPFNFSLAIFLLIFGVVSMFGAVLFIRRLKRTIDKLRNLK
jgi:hypothetical protein